MFQWLKDLFTDDYTSPPEYDLMECEFCRDAEATHLAMQFASCDYCVAPSVEGIERMKYLKEKYGS